MPSITYHLTCAVIKQKGIKKTFSQAPIDYQKLRKEDVHDYKQGFFSKNIVAELEVKKSKVTLIQPMSDGCDTLIIYCPGGAYVSGPAKYNWDSLAYLVKETKATAWLVDYPKAPEHQIGEMLDNVAAVYVAALDKNDPANIVFLGDSAGGALLIALLQRLIKEGKPLPAKYIGISPITDASMSNPNIAAIDKKDIMLSRVGVRSAKEMCAGNLDLKNPMISPLYGNFKGFPPSVLYLASYDIAYSDALLTAAKMKEEGVDVTVIVGEEMPHVWPLLPVISEGRKALKDIASRL